MTLADFALDLLAALAIGALVGLEREHRKGEGGIIAGIRTFPLVSAGGFLAETVAVLTGEHLIVAAATFGIIGMAAALFWIRSARGTPGMTTPMALVVTFLAGVLVGLGMTFEAILVGVATTFLLVTKDRLHGLARTMDDAEIMSALQFAAVAFVALPLALSLKGTYLGGLLGRERPLDPVWALLIVVAVSVIAFASFIALRRFGPRLGLLASGALGGLANSEAATASLASLSKAEPGVRSAATAGTLAATAAMLVRNLFIAAIAAPELDVARLLLLPILPMAAVAAGSAVWWARRGADNVPVRVDNPFAIRPAFRFAAVFVVVNALTWWLKSYGELGVYVASVGALVSAGAVVAAVATQAAGGFVSVQAAVITAMLATLIGVANKLFIAAVTDRPMLAQLLPAVLAVLGVGVIGVAAAVSLL